MKSTSGWNDNGNGNNSNGFSGLPGGYRLNYGNFQSEGGYGYWWSVSVYFEGFALGSYLTHYNQPDLYSYFDYKINGLSVRCVKD